MKRLSFAIVLLVISVIQTMAQQFEGAMYYLPKTELRFNLLIEKTTFTPGEFAIYSERFLKKTAQTEAGESYRIVGIEMYTTSIPDTGKQFVLPIDKKHSIFETDITDGMLTAINTKSRRIEAPKPFVAHPSAAAPNPHDFMSEDILKAASTAKMAELTAREIYDIRASRNELSRGEADYMPKDGEQLRLMFASLDRQESILSQTFTGVNRIDTVQQTIIFVPEKAGKQMIFRFSKKLGLVDNDNLAGAPYYINIEDLHILPEVQDDVEGLKPSKDIPVTICNPGKIKVTISEGSKAIKAFEAYAAQFGQPVNLSANLFGKKFTTRLRLNPITGGIESMEVTPLE